MTQLSFWVGEFNNTFNNLFLLILLLLLWKYEMISLMN